MSRDAVLFLEDIQTSCAKIVRFTADRTRDEVFVDEMRFDAVLLNLHIIGADLRLHTPRLALSGSIL